VVLTGSLTDIAWSAAVPLNEFDVVIVGGGPVGVGLAVDLGLRGVSCAVIERRTSVSDIPKGQGLNQRTLEHFYRWGIADELRAARTADDHANKVSMLTIYKDLTNEFWYEPPGAEIVQDYYFQRAQRLPQYRTEGVLRRRMSDLSNVHDRRGWTATAFAEFDDRVEVTVERDGATQTLAGNYLVGCDGGHSLVRDQSSIELRGTNFDQVMALVVFRSRELNEALKRLPGHVTYRVLHPELEGYWMFFGRVDSSEEWFFHAPVPAGADSAAVDYAALLRRAAGFDFACDIEHVGLWDLRVRVAQSYRSGRVFIAGDSAHTHPPYGGFGLNTGFEDAVNLGWKLTAALGGWGGEGLLDSYTTERRAIFHDIGENIIAAGIRRVRDVLSTYRPEDDRAEFDRVFGEMALRDGREMHGIEPQYEGSPIVFGPPGGVSDVRGEHTFTALPGHHLAPRLLSSGRNVFEELGSGFTLLAFDCTDAQVESFAGAAAARHIPLTVLRDSYGDERTAYGSRLVLVRPDQFVAWVGDQPPADPDHVLARISGLD
jgi:2-polyprenyl-6-methoxyphenol hydroxylase-like FAD-dependent oxidoreductase